MFSHTTVILMTYNSFSVLLLCGSRECLAASQHRWQLISWNEIPAYDHTICHHTKLWCNSGQPALILCFVLPSCHSHGGFSSTTSGWSRFFQPPESLLIWWLNNDSPLAHLHLCAIRLLIQFCQDNPHYHNAAFLPLAPCSYLLQIEIQGRWLPENSSWLMKYCTEFSHRSLNEFYISTVNQRMWILKKKCFY